MVPRHIIIAICLIPIAGTTCAGDLPDAARVIDSDMVWDFRAPDSFALSPDQSQVVYISRGALWVSKVATGPATKLMDLPNTLTEFMATDRYREDRKYFNRAGVAINDSKFRDRPDDNLTKVFGLKWNRNCIYFALAKGSGNRPWTVTYRILAASTEGRAEELTTIVRDTFDEFHRLTAFDVTGDESMVVVSDGYRPLICDTATGKPKATSFDRLTASATSGRFIGVEIDTREIVVTNPNLEVVKRTGVILPGNGFCELLWSPDERFVISKFHHREGPQRDRTEGHRLNLVTLERTQLQGDYRRDHLAFTGNGGEFIRTGANEIAVGRRVDGGDGTTVLVVADGDGPTTVVHTFTHRFPRADRMGIEKPYPPVTFNRSGTLFAMAMPREGEDSSYCYSLINREGQKWPLEPDDFTRYISPFHVLAITGEYLLATDDIHLFSIPLSSLQNQP